MHRITYASDGRTVAAEPGETLLETSLRCGIPHTHECGGEARCSTCRVAILEGLAHCAPRTPRERAMAERLRFAPDIRLACQTRVTGDVVLRRLVLDADDVRITDQRHAGGLPGHAGEERMLCVMFADVRGFTSFAESLPPHDVVHSLNRVFCSLGTAIGDHGGHIDNYMGDGLMALFDDRDPDRAALQAVRAGFAMLDAIEALQSYFIDTYGKPLQIGIGVHSGEAVVGSIGAAAMKRTTAIGDTVNLASRIESANKQLGTRFLVSAAVHQRIAHEVACRCHPDVCLPGKAGAYTLYEPLSAHPDP